MVEVERSEETSEMLGGRGQILDVRSNRDGCRKERFENGSYVSGVETHQGGDRRTRRVRSSVPECGVCRCRIWAGGEQGI